MPAVLELIHAAALSPAGWDAVLRSLASMTGCIAGGLTVERPTTRQGTPLTYFGFDPDHVARSFDHFLPMNPLFRIEPQMQRGFVVANGDVVAPDVFRRSDFFNGWARPQGLGSPITVVIHRTNAAYVPLTLVRPDGAGEATQDSRALLARLAGHLVHAMDVTVRLQASGGLQQDFGLMLEAMPCGALLIDQAQRVVFANTVATGLLHPTSGGALSCVRGRVVVRDPAADRRFQAALFAALGLNKAPRGSHVAVRHPGDGRRLSISLTPLPMREAVWSALGEDALGRARCMVLISTPNLAQLAQRFGLTPAETRVLSAVAIGKGLSAAAAELGIARSTAQSHLDKIFQKTGTNRQAELAGLVQAGPGA